MKRILFLFVLLFVSCSSVKAGIIYQDTTVPIIATDIKKENIKNLKVGEAQIFHCLGIIDTGNAGIQKAAIRGGIKNIHHVDVRTKTILGIGMTTIKVYGE